MAHWQAFKLALSWVDSESVLFSLGADSEGWARALAEAGPPWGGGASPWMLFLPRVVFTTPCLPSRGREHTILSPFPRRALVRFGLLLEKTQPLTCVLPPSLLRSWVASSGTF